MKEWDWSALFWSIVVAILVICSTIVGVTAIRETQETNRKLVENGYEQRQDIGSNMYRWQKAK